MIVLNQYDLGKLSDFENQKTSTLTCEVEIKSIFIFRLKYSRILILIDTFLDMILINPHYAGVASNVIHGVWFEVCSFKTIAVST